MNVHGVQLGHTLLELGTRSALCVRQAHIHRQQGRGHAPIAGVNQTHQRGAIPKTPVHVTLDIRDRTGPSVTHVRQAHINRYQGQGRAPIVGLTQTHQREALPKTPVHVTRDIRDQTGPTVKHVRLVHTNRQQGRVVVPRWGALFVIDSSGIYICLRMGFPVPGSSPVHGTVS
jgi:hypothetical protein